MSDREHFIATLQACYVGDRNAFDEIVRIYDKKENIIKEVREYIVKNKQYAELKDYGKNGEYYIDETGLLEILDKGE